MSNETDTRNMTAEVMNGFDSSEDIWTDDNGSEWVRYWHYEKLATERDALRKDNKRLEKRAYLTVSLCCYPQKEEAEFSYENADGDKVAFTLKMPKEIMHDVANVIGPCVYYDAAIDAAKGAAVSNLRQRLCANTLRKG